MITFIRTELAHGLSLASKVLANREVIPSLTCFLFEAENDVCTIQATNLKESIQVRVSCQSDNKEVFALNGRIALNVIDRLDSETVDFTITDKVAVQHDKGKATLLTTPIVNMPQFPTYPADNSIKIDRIDFIDALKLIGFAVSQDALDLEHKRSALFKVEGERFVLAGAGITGLLSKASGAALGAPREALLPASALKQLPYILMGIYEDSIELSDTENQFFLNTKTASYAFGKSHGTFQNIDLVLARNADTKCDISSRDILDAIDRIMVFSGMVLTSGMKSHPSSLDFTLDSLKFFAQERDIGAIEETIPITLRGEPIQVKYDLKKLREIFARMDTECTFGITAERFLKVEKSGSVTGTMMLSSLKNL